MEPLHRPSPLPLVAPCVLLRKRRLCPASRRKRVAWKRTEPPRLSGGLGAMVGPPGTRQVGVSQRRHFLRPCIPAEQSGILASTMLAPSTLPDSLQQNFGLLALFGIAKAQIHNLGRALPSLLMRTCFWLAHGSAGREGTFHKRL